ncbi:uncharacterized protein LOC131678007 [Topomyia yanbarensis]|uniref:uncharacterized protein LOC131678007 n=1 Tax=Topomyia yanbarensis TaxID=2498891 RepID=UPI00273B91B8|nr:uncharacterized protein LOC131678007 [Topomyia yanbarensis]
MFSSTGFDLLLLAAGISDPPVGEEVASIVADTPTVANFEEVEFVNKTTNNTFLEGVSMIISSTPIRKSGVITFTDPRQTLPLDLSVSMIENEQPLNLTMQTSDVPLDLAMPKSNTSKKLATEKAINLCVAIPEQKQSLTISSLPSTHQGILPESVEYVEKASNARFTLPAQCAAQAKYKNDMGPGLYVLSPQYSESGSETAFDHTKTMDHQGQSMTVSIAESFKDSDRSKYSNPGYIQENDTDSDSENHENVTVEVSEYFEPFANQTLISTDESSDESNCESEGNSDIEQKVSVTTSPFHSFDDNQGDNSDKDQLISRKKRPAWVIRKERKERGFKYQRTNGTFAPARSIKKACQCSRLECYSKYNDTLRGNILKNLLKLSSSGQNQFICSHVIVKPIARTRVINSRRIATRIYNLPALNGQNRVCKTMFVNTLDIGDKKVRWLATKSVANGGICPDDMRADNFNPHALTEQEIDSIKQHIMSFPSSESHYSREKSSKKYLSSDLSVAKMYDLYKEQCTTIKAHAVHYNTYRKVFRSLNLSFRKPRVDTCNTCDEMQTRLRMATDGEKAPIKKELETHHQNAQDVYNQKRLDIEKAKNADDTCTISFDLQNPHLNCGEVFYLRQMYTYNLTIFVTDKSGNTARCCLWDGSQARRGAQEVGSCLLKFLFELPKNIRFLNCYSDRCFGQNCNTIICSMFSAFTIHCIEQKRDITITHNFMVSGHSHMECDSVHSTIERAKKKSSINIEIPKDWSTFISGIRRKVPFKVVEMEQQDFLALKDLDKIFKKPSLDIDGNGLRFQKIMCFRYQTTLPGCIEFKYDISNPTWSQFIFGSANIRTVVLPDPINREPIALPQAKLDDLRKQLKYIKNKPYYETFLKEIVPKKRGRKPVNNAPDNFDMDMDMELHEEEIDVKFVLASVILSYDCLCIC